MTVVHSTAGTISPPPRPPACCETCRFWQRGEGWNPGECRRRAPVLAPQADPAPSGCVSPTYLRATFPPMPSNGWCGDWETKP